MQAFCLHKNDNNMNVGILRSFLEEAVNNGLGDHEVCFYPNYQGVDEEGEEMNDFNDFTVNRVHIDDEEKVSIEFYPDTDTGVDTDMTADVLLEQLSSYSDDLYVYAHDDDEEKFCDINDKFNGNLPLLYELALYGFKYHPSCPLKQISGNNPFLFDDTTLYIGVTLFRDDYDYDYDPIKKESELEDWQKIDARDVHPKI